MSELGARLPAITTALPGPVASRWVEALAATECPSLTERRARRRERSGASHDPIVWAEARGANVLDADGNVYVDLTAGFGVAAAGHAHPRVVRAVQEQMARLPHALGDVHPSVPKVELLTRLSALAPFEGAQVILGLNGADAVAAALKTAALHTGRPGVLAFDGGYHGLMYGPLALCGFSPEFRAPFAAQLNPHVRFAPYPARASELQRALASLDDAWGPDIGAVVVEPALGRGGCRIPAEGFLAALSRRCEERGACLVIDEIFTGLGRTGVTWAHATEGVRADILCLGKALGGGLPISACVARPDVMRAWGDPEGAAIHAATFAGNPLACAAALAALDVYEDEELAERSRSLGRHLREALDGALAGLDSVVEVRGAGLMVGVEVDDGSRTLRLVRALLERGFLTLPSGPRAETLQIAPPLTIARAQLDAFVTALREAW